MQSTGGPSSHPSLSKLVEPPQNQPVTTQRNPLTAPTLFPYKFYNTARLNCKQLPSAAHSCPSLRFLMFARTSSSSPLEQCFRFGFFSNMGFHKSSPQLCFIFQLCSSVLAGNCVKCCMAFPPSLGWRVPALYFVSNTVLCLPSFSTFPISSVDGRVPGCCPLCWSIPHTSFLFLLLFLCL